MSSKHTASGRRLIGVVLLLQTLLFLPSLVRPGLIRTPLPKVSDGTSQVYLWHAFWRDEVQAGRLPLWNPYVYGGVPAFAEPQMQTWYPANVLWLVLSADLAFKATLWLHALLGAWLMYRLARAVGTTRFGAAVAALVFGLHGQLLCFVYAGWIQHVAAMTWAPGVLWMLWRALYTPGRSPARWIAGGALALGLQILSGHPEWVRYTLVIGAFIVLAKSPRPFRDRLTIGAAIVLLGCLIGAPQLLPAIQAATESARGQMAVHAGPDLAGAGFPLLTLPTILVPRLFGPWDLQTTTNSLAHLLLSSRAAFGESLLYVGILPLGLAWIGFRGRDTPAARLWAAVAIAGLLVALNDWTHLQSLFDRVVPPDAVFRTPARFVFLSSVGLSVLAGLGASRLERDQSRGRETQAALRTIAAGLAIGAALLWLTRSHLREWVFGHFAVPARIATHPLLGSDGGASLIAWAGGRAALALLVAALFAAAAAAVLALAARRTSRSWQGAIILVIAADLSVFGWPFISSVVPVPAIYMRDLATLAPVTGLPGVRIASGKDVFESGPNVPMLAHVRSITGYDTFTLASWERVIRATNQGDPDRASLGVTHVIDHDGAGELILRPVARPRGRAWWTGRTDTAPDADAAAARLPASLEDDVLVVKAAAGVVGRGAFVDGAARPTVHVDRDDPGDIRLHLDAPADGWVIVTEMDYPGWRATVNGAAAPVVRAFGALQAVRVPGGPAVVALAFAPALAGWGCGGGIAGLIIAVGLVAVPRWRRRNPS